MTLQNCWSTADSSNIKTLLAHYQIELDEAVIFGIAGGIGAGYSFCPSVPRHGSGSGVSVVGRHQWADTQGHYYKNCFDRLGLTTTIAESTSPNAAEKTLRDALAQHDPALVWCSGLKLPYLSLATPLSTCGWMQTVLVTDVADNEFTIHDQARQTFSVTPAELRDARNGICSHKNRLMTINAAEINPLEQAITAGLQSCVKELLQPHIKMFSLYGLQEWAKLITNNTNQKGWRKVFKPYFLYQALRDVFVSIETQGTGGGLYRPIFAQFLTQTADILSQPQFNNIADYYQHLAAAWTDLAQSALTDAIKPFADIKMLLQKQNTIFLQQGGAGMNALEKVSAQIKRKEAQIENSFPLSEAEVVDLLQHLREKISKLHDAEQNAIQQLAAAVDCLQPVYS